MPAQAPGGDAVRGAKKGQCLRSREPGQRLHGKAMATCWWVHAGLLFMFHSFANTAKDRGWSLPVLLSHLQGVAVRNHAAEVQLCDSTARHVMWLFKFCSAIMHPRHVQERRCSTQQVAHGIWDSRCC